MYIVIFQVVNWERYKELFHSHRKPFVLLLHSLITGESLDPR